MQLGNAENVLAITPERNLSINLILLIAAGICLLMPFQSLIWARLISHILCTVGMCLMSPCDYYCLYYVSLPR